MNIRIAAAAATAVLTLVGLTACGEDTDSGSTDTPPAATEEQDAPAVEEEPVAEEPAEDGPGSLPDLVGMSLQDAQDTAQAAGFYGLTSHDATGMERFQALDRNWTVCSQEPAAGEHPVDSIIDFGAVKQGEACP